MYIDSWIITLFFTLGVVWYLGWILVLVGEKLQERLLGIYSSTYYVLGEMLYALGCIFLVLSSGIIASMGIWLWMHMIMSSHPA